MKTEKYIVEIKMPDGDNASPSWVKDVLQSDADIEDDGRWKVSVKNGWKPSEKQIDALEGASKFFDFEKTEIIGRYLRELLKQLKAL